MVDSLSSAAQASDKELCKHGGWQNLVSSTGAPFANQGECVDYADNGGVLFPKVASLDLTYFNCGGFVPGIIGCA